MSRLNSGEGQTGETEQQKGVTDQLKDQAQHVAQSIRDIGHTARSAATEHVGHLRDQADEYYDQGRHKVQDVEKSLEHYVQEKPVHALLVAAGVGLLLGLLWRK